MDCLFFFWYCACDMKPNKKEKRYEQIHDSN